MHFCSTICKEDLKNRDSVACNKEKFKLELLNSCFTNEKWFDEIIKPLSYNFKI